MNYYKCEHSNEDKMCDFCLTNLSLPITLTPTYFNIDPKLVEQLQRIEDKIDELLRKS
jgi:hypothetical protein